MNRELYKKGFPADDAPVLKCPSCGLVSLVFDESSLAKVETAKSKDLRHDQYWNDSLIENVFSCFFHCKTSYCSESLVCTGTTSVETFRYEDVSTGLAYDYEDEILNPIYFNPPLILMDYPNACPEAIVKNLKDSFALSFSDPRAALNCMRSSVEALMGELGIPEFRDDEKTKKISLHERIERMPQKYKEEEKILLALKWLGNAGSHDGDEVTAADMWFAYDAFEYVLLEIYEGRYRRIREISDKVNENKGPLLPKNYKF